MKKDIEQFTQIPHSLMSNKDLTDQDKLTLGVILSFIKNGKECYIGNDTLGHILGISKNAASSRVSRLQKIGCISLRYTYKDGKKEVDKRYITLLSLTPQVSSRRRRVLSDRQRGIVQQTKGYRPTDEEVSSKLGGIIQTDYTSVLDNLKDKSLDKLQYKEKPLLGKFQLENTIEALNSKKSIPDKARSAVIELISTGNMTRRQKEVIETNIYYFKDFKLLKDILNFTQK